jgi:ParB-like chromosome segregation protein Spo0J
MTKPTTAAGPPQAGATQPAEVPKMAAGPPQAGKKQPAEVFELERAEATLQMVPYLKIIAKPEDYSFRKESDEDPFSDKALRSLKEAIKRDKGVRDPLLLKAIDNGLFLVVDGHRRLASVAQLIADRVAGFKRSMELPANVLQAGTREVVMVAASVSANFDRLAIGGVGRMDAAQRLNKLGMPRASIAQLFQVGISTIDRDLLLAGDDEMLNLVRREHIITMSNAATLLAAAHKVKRRDDLTKFLYLWANETQKQIFAENKERAAKDESQLPAEKMWPQSRMSAAMVRAWKDALLKKAPLSDPGFRFRAAVSTAGGSARVEVDALSKKVDDLSAADMAKIVKRCLDLAADIEPLMIAKAEAEKAGASEAEAKKPSAGMQHLRKLGLDGLVGETDVQEEVSDDSEDVESDPTESDYMDQEDDVEGETHGAEDEVSETEEEAEVEVNTEVE